MDEQITDEQTIENETSWLDEELQKCSKDDTERLPSLILEENKIVKITVDFSQPFKSWADPESDKVKKLIPVRVGEVDLIWWVNIKNPVYHDLIKKGMEGQKEFKILQTGKKEKTKYSIVEE